MPSQFKHYLPLTPEEKTDIQQNGLIVLDANIFLAVYRLPHSAAEAFISILKHEKILKRLFIPHQVAEEFFRNRITVISDQVKYAQEVMDLLKAHQKSLQDEINAKIRKHHPLLNRDSMNEEIVGMVDSIEKKFKETQDKYPINLDEDPFLSEIMILMNGRIGDELEEEAYKKAITEATRRKNEKIPPGYKDDSIGDYLIWEQMMIRSLSESKHILFVTEDAKNDWWLNIRGEKQNAHPFLRKEFRERTKCEVYFLSLEAFQKWADAYLDISSDSSLQDALTEPLTDSQGSSLFACNQNDSRLPGSEVSGYSGYSGAGVYPNRLGMLGNSGSRMPLDRSGYHPLDTIGRRHFREDPLNLSSLQPSPEFIAQWFMENYEQKSFDQTRSDTHIAPVVPYNEIARVFHHVGQAQVNRAASIVQANTQLQSSWYPRTLLDNR